MLLCILLSREPRALALGGAYSGTLHSTTRQCRTAAPCWGGCSCSSAALPLWGSTDCMPWLLYFLWSLVQKGFWQAVPIFCAVAIKWHLSCIVSIHPLQLQVCQHHLLSRSIKWFEQPGHDLWLPPAQAPWFSSWKGPSTYKAVVMLGDGHWWLWRMERCHREGSGGLCFCTPGRFSAQKVP